MNFFALNLQAFRKAGLLLFVVVVLTSQADQYISKLVEESMRNPEGMTTWVYFYGLLSLACSLVFPTLLTLISLFALQNKPETSQPVQYRLFFKQELPEQFPQLLIESLRAWGKILLWSFVFIVPGVVKYVSYTLIPFVVTSLPDYQAGKVDALKTSSYLVRKNGGKILFTILLFHFFMPLVLTTLFDEYRLLWQNPVQSLLLSLLDAYLYLLGTQVFLWIFKNSLGTTLPSPVQPLEAL